MMLGSWYYIVEHALLVLLGKIWLFSTLRGIIWRLRRISVPCEDSWVVKMLLPSVLRNLPLDLPDNVPNAGRKTLYAQENTVLSSFSSLKLPIVLPTLG